MSKLYGSHEEYAEYTCRREILLPRHRPSFTDAEWAELETMALKPAYRRFDPDTDLAAPQPTTDTWIVWHEGSAADLAPHEWQIAGRDGWVYRAPLAFNFRAAWLPGDVMAYYPLSLYHC